MMKNRLNKQGNKNHMTKIFKLTIVILFFILILISLTGYISVGNDATKFDLIIQRKPLNGSSDIPMRVGQVLFSFVSILINYKHLWDSLCILFLLKINFLDSLKREQQLVIT